MSLKWLVHTITRRENLVSKFRVHNIGVGIHNRGHVLLLKAKQDKNLLHTHIHYLKLTASISKVEQIYAKIYISETAHTAYCPGQHCTVRGLEFGVWEKTENDHRKKVSQGEEKSKEKVCDHHTPQSMQSLLRRPLSEPAECLKIQERGGGKL